MATGRVLGRIQHLQIEFQTSKYTACKIQCFSCTKNTFDWNTHLNWYTRSWSASDVAAVLTDFWDVETEFSTLLLWNPRKFWFLSYIFCIFTLSFCSCFWKLSEETSHDVFWTFRTGCCCYRNLFISFYWSQFWAKFSKTNLTPYPEPMLLNCLKTLLFVLLCIKVSNVLKILLFQTLQQWKFSGLVILAVGVLQTWPQF